MGLIVAVVLALAGTIGIVTYVNAAEHRAQAGEALVKVLVVKESVPAGTPAKELGDRVGLESISRKVMADGAATSVKALGNKVAGTTLVAGEQVLSTRFVAKSNFSATGANVQVPPGLLRTTIALDPQRVLGGVVTPGARVAVLASFDPYQNNTGRDLNIDGVTVADGKSSLSSTRLILHKVLVTNVQLTGTVTTSDDTSGEKTADTNKPGNAPSSQMLVTLALDPTATERMVYALEFGRLWLSIEPSDVAETPSIAQQRSTVTK